jgi:hypothetical protein
VIEGACRNLVKDRMDLHAWFTVHGRNAELLEEVIGLGNYGKTLTVLSAQSMADPEEEEEEAQLLSSWTPTFSRSRRR